MESGDLQMMTKMTYSCTESDMTVVVRMTNGYQFILQTIAASVFRLKMKNEQISELFVA